MSNNMGIFQGEQTQTPGFTYDPQTQSYVDPTTGQRMSQTDYSYKMKAQQESDNAARNHMTMQSQGLNDDGSPIRQAYNSLVDSGTGKLKDGYELQTAALDPTKWDGYSKYKQEALRTGPSAWAGLQTAQNNQNTLNNKENATRQAASGMNQANSALAMRGGLSEGSRSLTAASSARDMLMARQQAARAGDTANMQTATTDESNRIGQLSSLATSEQNIGQYNNTLAAKTAEYNVGNMVQDHQGANAYSDKTYEEQMKKWAADKQAQATANSGGGGGGCCFIFLESRYGNGAMDKVVRRFRDENMTDQNKRGYYKLSEVLVPLMRKSKVVRFLVAATMTTPLVAYGKAHYGEGSRLGLLLAPIKNFWLKTFNYLGQEHTFVRENGETV